MRIYCNCKQSIGSLKAAPPFVLTYASSARTKFKVCCNTPLIVDNIIALNYSFQSPIILNQLLCLCTCVYVHVYSMCKFLGHLTMQ